jgi:hypothetical protein
LIKFLFRTILVLFFVEGILHIVKPEALEFYRIQKTYHKLDSEYFVDLEPNVNVIVKHFQRIFTMEFSTNEFGFRASEKTDNSKDQILCIGDSVVMGFGVNDKDTFCKKLDNFQDREGKKYQALNLGVDAYGPSAIHLKLKKNIPKLNPKLLIYFPSKGDEIDEEKFQEKINHPEKSFFFEVQFQLAKYSYTFLSFKIFQENLVYRFKETFIWNFEKAQKYFLCRNSSEEICKDFHLTAYKISEDFLMPEKKKNNQPTKFADNECSDNELFFELPKSVLSETENIISLAKLNNMQIIFFLAPIDLETAYCYGQNKFHHFFSYHASMKKFLISKKIDFVDMSEFTNQMTDLDEMNKKRFNVRPYYIEGDGHYTDKGNEWVYQIVKKKIYETFPEVKK